jgi:hypothetical protein
MSFRSTVTKIVCLLWLGLPCVPGCSPPEESGVVEEPNTGPGGPPGAKQFGKNSAKGTAKGASNAGGDSASGKTAKK